MNLINIANKIKNKEPFALIRFGDGEYNILQDIACKRNGFNYDPNNGLDSNFRKQLYESLCYDGGKNYFVGICNKNVGKNSIPHNRLKNKVKGTVIDASIFINENYLKFLELFIPLFKGATMIGHEKGDYSKLPFKVDSYLKITNNAWRNLECQLIDISLLYWLFDKKDPQIILVAGGAYSNVLIHNLWKKNKNHIYIDVGSTFDPYLFGVNTRKYHQRRNK